MNHAPGRTPSPSGDASAVDRDEQIASLTEIIDSLAHQVTDLEARHNRLIHALGRHGPQHDTETDTCADHEPAAPAPWTWSTPPRPDDPGRDQDPRQVVETFVHWYNQTYTGVDAGRATPIPPCWREHPGLAMEIATLCHTWRQANLGPQANVRDAQLWHHQWRTGFADRLTRDWTHPDCRDGQHRPAGGSGRCDRGSSRPAAGTDLHAMR